VSYRTCSLKKQTMRMNKPVILSSEQQLFIVRLPCRLRGTYITWLLGFDPYFLMSRETYYRHAQDLSQNYGVEIRKKSPYYLPPKTDY
jgi:hypothetical protein